MGDKIKGRLEGVRVKSIGGWCNKVKDRSWLAPSCWSEQEERKKEEERRFEKIKDFIVSGNAGEDSRGSGDGGRDDDMTFGGDGGRDDGVARGGGGGGSDDVRRSSSSMERKGCII